MKMGIHKAYNKFPQILRYIIPRRLTLPQNPAIYKWLWFWIVF